MPSPFAVPIELTAEERAQLEAWERRRTSAQALALRSRIVLAAAEGPNNSEIARDLGIAVSSVRKWRNRFAEHRLGWLDRRAAAWAAQEDQRRQGRGGDRQDAGDDPEGCDALVDAFDGRRGRSQ